MELSVLSAAFFFPSNCEGGQTLAQVVHRGCAVSLLGDIQNPTGHSSGQRAVADPA